MIKRPLRMLRRCVYIVFSSSRHRRLFVAKYSVRVSVLLYYFEPYQPPEWMRNQIKLSFCEFRQSSRSMQIHFSYEEREDSRIFVETLKMRKSKIKLPNNVLLKQVGRYFFPLLLIGYLQNLSLSKIKLRNNVLPSK